MYMYIHVHVYIFPDIWHYLCFLSVQEEVEISLKVYDLDLSSDVDHASDLVDVFVISPSISSTTHAFSNTTRYSGDNDIAHIELAYRLTCSADHYGSDCSYCVYINNETGHYSCDADTGEKICLEGYQNPVTDCIECSSAHNCSECTRTSHTCVPYANIHVC